MASPGVLVRHPSSALESVLMRWMKLEPIIKSEVRQEKKNPTEYISEYIWNLETW